VVIILKLTVHVVIPASSKILYIHPLLMDVIHCTKTARMAKISKAKSIAAQVEVY
jgi:hypothetical protein